MVKRDGYGFLPHTADVKFRAYGKTLEDAFKNAAYALTDTITNHKKVRAKIKKEIKVKSENREALLYDFLEHFLVLVDTDEFLLNNVKSIKISKKKGKYELTAVFIGDKVSKKYEIDTHIKAVTYQQMQIKKVDGKYMLQVILDV